MISRKIITVPEAQFAEKGATIFTEKAMLSIKKSGAFTVALSGGSTPRDMHRCLVKKPFISSVSWDKVHFFWVDERMVPYDHRDSNYGAAKQDLLKHIPNTNVYPMPVDIEPALGAVKYHENLKRHFTNQIMKQPVFDLIILGMGNDGHTASLFPGKDDVDTSDQLIRILKGGNPDVYRMTMTLSLLNMARCILFLVSGTEKSSMVRDILENFRIDLPAAKVIPDNGNLIWLLDDHAASLLKR